MSKEKFLQEVEESLVSKLTNQQLEMVTDEIIKILKNYDVTQGSHEIIPYENINQDILRRFCACQIIEGKAENTINAYMYTAGKLCDSVQKHLPDMTVYDIRLFLAYEKQRGVSNRTLENTRANLSALFQWMVQEEIINCNPFTNINKIKYDKKIRTPLSQVELDALKTACKNLKERALIEVLLSTGVRVSELANMKVSDIDFASMTVKVVKGKGSKQRTTYINDLARLHLKKYLENRAEDGEYLFYNKKHEPICPSGIRYLLKELGKRSGVENVHPHRFRRTFASGLASRGMDVQEIQKLLGHKNINTTMEYIYTDQDRIQNSYRRYIA